MTGLTSSEVPMEDGDPSQEGLELQLQVDEEMKKYLEVSSTPASKDSDIIQWWQQNTKELPLLAVLSRKYLCVPAICSVAEEVHGNKANLNFEENVFEKLTIIRENLRVVNIE